MASERTADRDAQAARTSLRTVLLSSSAAALSILLLARAARLGFDQMRAPFDLGWETPALSTVEILRAGGNPYDPAVYERKPFVLTMYPPLYHIVVARLPEHPSNPFFSGRLVSCVAMLIAAGGLVLIGWRQSPWPTSLLAFAVFLSFFPVLRNTVYFRQDPLALCLSILAVIVAAKLRDRRWGPALSALLCFLALATKQTYISAAVACTGLMAFSGRRAFQRFVVASLGFLALWLTLAGTLGGRGFWFSILRAATQDLRALSGGHIVIRMLDQPTFYALLGLVTVLGVDACRRRRTQLLRDSPYPLYALSTSAVLLMAGWKVGAGTNYLLEPLLAMLAWCVFALRGRSVDWLSRGVPLLATAGVLLTAGLQFALAKRSDYSLATRYKIERNARFYERMRADIDDLGFDSPTILLPIPHHQRHTYSVTDRSFLNDPLLYGLLYQEGILDDRPLLESIARQDYDIVLMPRHYRRVRNMDTWLQRLEQAIDAGYATVYQNRKYRYLVGRKP